MGYIFDALNKSGDKSEREQQDPIDATPNALPQEAEQPLLRLEDILRKHNAPAPVQPVFSQIQDDKPAKADDADALFAAAEQAIVPDLAGTQHLAPIKATATTVVDTDDTEDEDASLPQDNPAEYSSLRMPGVVTNAKAQRRWFGFWKKQGETSLDDRLVVMTNPASAMAEEYRSIRTSILARHQNERHLIHTITSATPQEGKTITCMNLGLAFSELRNRKTVVVECDLRLPTFEKLLQLNHPTGLIPYLHGDISLSDAITRVEGTGLDVITAGGRVSDEAVQMLSSTRMSRLIQSLRAKYDHVIIDTPPVVDLADAGILGAQGDEVLLVARMRRTPQQLVEQAIRTLSSYNAQVAGVIATDNPRSRGRGYGYRYGYGYHYTYAGKRRGKRRYAA